MIKKNRQQSSHSCEQETPHLPTPAHVAVKAPLLYFDRQQVDRGTILHQNEVHTQVFPIKFK